MQMMQIMEEQTNVKKNNDEDKILEYSREIKAHWCYIVIFLSSFS